MAVRLIILGAGRPFAGDLPSGLRQIDRRRRVLDWTLHAFAALKPDVYFVGGYRIGDIMVEYGNLTYIYNERWAETGALASLYAAPLSDECDHYVCYSDIVFRESLVNGLAALDASSIGVSADPSFRLRYGGERQAEGAAKETLRQDGDRVLELGVSLSGQGTLAEFVGLVRLPKAVMPRVTALKRKADSELGKQHLSALVEALRDAGEDVRALDAAGCWSELNNDIDLSRFVFGTKAETLERLRQRVRRSIIDPQVQFPVARWRDNREAVLDAILEGLGADRLAVRSSALSEDGFKSAHAGRYRTRLDVARNRTAIAVAVDDVITSYDDNAAHQIFVQPMLSDVQMSGVIFTRSLNSGAPYYTINFSVGADTANITSGASQDHRTLVIHRAAKRLPDDTPPAVMSLLAAVREIEDLVDYDALDVEFAVQRSDIHVLQVRPMTVAHERAPADDARTEQVLRAAAAQFERLMSPSPEICGKRVIWGCMPDWNPAEMIGTRPGQLAVSLYRNLITDEIWATQRAELGYRDVRPTPLMRLFAGQPYIDVRASFNSFVPAAVGEATAERLVDHYIGRLHAEPELHDKVEFEIVPTCCDFDFGRWQHRLAADAGLGPREIEQLHDGLRAITRAAIGRFRSDLDTSETLTKRFIALRDSGLPPLERAVRLLADCRRYGTLPFAHLARSAFIAMTLLKSATSRGAISPERLGEFMASIRTVGHRFAEDAAAVGNGALGYAEFVERYGHLRPGTYDITSLSYGAQPDRYLAPTASQAIHRPPSEFRWTDMECTALERLLAEAGLSISLAEFDAFLRGAIEGRERGKFLFSRNLSLALEDIAAFGATVGLDRDELAEIDIADLSAISVNGMASTDVGHWLRDIARNAHDGRLCAQAAELPPLLRSVDDFSGFFYPHTEPNYVTTGRVTAPCVDLDHAVSADGKELSGKIVLISRADPGYDWLFGHGIAGLITIFGGANSHMAIRAAEFCLPSAIGIGHSRYNNLSGARMIDLNCRARQMLVVA